ncbi:Perlucin [Frankliniella fusca]|uniref:Perlucin n=1 Tax=Frankliniella fusca TaxID=407009 RepID=A0AAE1LPY1_9NEOP|nr:Perlucin [Frankliniella fusca]
MVEPGGARRQYSCPARFIRMGNSCYFMSTLMASWHEAHYKCRSMGAQLAAFEKRWENRNMRKYLKHEELTPLSRWIGAIYQWEKRFWMWGSTGLAVAYNALPRRMVSRDWTWHCIALDPTSDYQWRPASCLDAKHYICEAPLRRGRARNGTKQHKGPHRKSGAEAADKAEPGSRGQQPAAAGRHHSGLQGHQRERVGNATAQSAAPRAPGAGRSRPSTFSRNRTAYRRPHTGQHHGHRGYRPPPPPPASAPASAPRQHGRPAAWPGTGPGPGAGAVGAASQHQPRRLAYNAYDVLPAPARDAGAGADRARGPSQGAPRQRGSGASARISFRTEPREQQQQQEYRHLEIPDMTVQSLYPPRPQARAENNDFSNDV